MSKNFKLKAEVRDRKGSKASEIIRESGKIPAVIYGHKEEAVAVSLDKHDFVEGVHHGHRLIDLNIGKKKETVIIKDVQYDHLGQDLIHADLMRVSESERVEVEVRVEIKGTAKGQSEGGIVELHTGTLEIECPVTQIPESIVIKIAELGLDEKIFAKQVELPAGAKMVSDPETLVVSCHTIAEAPTTEELEAEAPTAPEVITEAKKSEDEGSAKEKGQ